MSISTCPVATVEAPVEQVWQRLADPSNYGLWWDAETCWQFAMEPAGPTKPGQRISARTRALGKDWNVRITVASIDPHKRALDLTTQLPFGITVHNHIVCATLDNQHCRVTERLVPQYHLLENAQELSACPLMVCLHRQPASPHSPRHRQRYRTQGDRSLRAIARVLRSTA